MGFNCFYYFLQTSKVTGREFYVIGRLSNLSSCYFDGDHATPMYTYSYKLEIFSNAPYCSFEFCLGWEFAVSDLPLLLIGL